MSTRRYTAAHAVLAGRLYVIGGWNLDAQYINSVERYNPLVDRWETVAPMCRSRDGAAACVLHGFIYVFGGNEKREGYMRRKTYSIERYDPGANSWTEVSLIL